ncbi:phosphate transporter [Glomus cerebriforme]|uniref:Phosphate transporter n=1 Tax=Glomus cerebriforme TaxID=658196 RepID=A0A397T270_9GLOM|nr:phosphate transporter [Glomus cerebriforme]
MPIDFIEKRRAALKEIDDAKFGWHHVRACLVAGTGFFMDAYDLFAINFASSMIGYVYYGGKTPSNIDLGLKVSGSIGNLVGQLFFGWLADRLGRKRMYGIELIIIITATVASALCGESYAITVVGTIIFWRVIMGIGIGGDYPLSSIITSEFATKKRRGAMMAAVFAMQGFGILASALVALIVLAAFKNSIIHNVMAVDYCWRLVLGLGAVPGLFALYFRLTIPETPRYTMEVECNLKKATSDITSYLKQKNDQHDNPNDHNDQNDHNDPNDNHDGLSREIPKASWSDFRNYFGKWHNGKVLLGTSMSWFALDIAFYGIGLNNGIILRAIGYADTKDTNINLRAYNSLKNMAIGNIIITIMGTIPGYWVTVLFVDKWGRKPIQLMGFIVLTILFIVMGVAFTPLKTHSIAAFIVLFVLLQFFQNFGPNTTTFIVPGEVFPTRYRSTGHGISAASGKFGAIVAQVGFSKLKDIGGTDAFVGKLLIIFAAWMFIGGVFTLLIPETKGLSLEELANEEHYYDTKDKENSDA